MAYKIAIASGKGGTGKTSVSVNLFHSLNKHIATSIIDCDVEEPNDLIFFPEAKFSQSKDVFLQVAEINTEKCSFCRKCVDWCEFNAISVIPPVQYAKIDPQLCHACGACLHACEDQAILEVPHQIGKINQYKITEETILKEGNLKIGSPMQTSLIKALKKELKTNAEIILYDAPPGTSCPVVETIADTNFVIVVAEPTPFGLHDLKLMINLLREVKIPFGVIINKAGMNFADIYDYLKDNHIEILAEIPFSKNYAGLYSAGEILQHIPEEFETIYQQLSNKLLAKLKNYEGAHHT